MPPSSPPPQSPAASGARVRVATFNIHHGANSRNVLDLESTAHALDALEADVIGLQEVDRFFGTRSDFVDQAAWLADRLDMHAQFAPTIDLDPSRRSVERVGISTRRQYGIAVLSRFPILESHMARLPENRLIERRAVLRTRIDAEGVPFSFSVTHLALGSARARRAQFRAAREVAFAGDEPAVLVGDLNAAPSQVRDYAVFTKGLTDVWAATHRFPLAKRFLGRTNPVLPIPARRIDYILASRDIRPVSAKTHRTHASDHLPVVAELEIPHAEPAAE
ncbi:endonuclease/exonuclease/phosphatase family protein [Dermabacter vaginalis]|uniref:endonuclease/exonuclease/phosphatase family protein n=1 Tax=Dermabacter vaginalis TaxID=1630135 RepID=UPI0021A27BF1|nr:endonuclease/exonuclease/phosphatase family protein [Dermabacter vaginalis]MCT2149771.1 endonuclease/exonuclease/phosphatase family protein [Dermabacter vaginalis]